MNGLGNQLFAGTTFTLDQYGGAAGGDLANEVKDPQHGVALADDILKRVALPECALELFIFLFSAAAGHGSADIRQQLFIIPGLLDEVGGAVLDCANGIIDCAVGGNHDDGKLGITVADIGQNFQTVAVRQREIKQHQVKRRLRQFGQAFFTGFCRLYRVTFKLQKRFQRFADCSFIIDDKNGPPTAFSTGALLKTATSDID